MYVLIIGGTGLISTGITRQADAAGHDVTVFTRGKTDANLADSVNYITGDRTVRVALERARDELSLGCVIDIVGFDLIDIKTAIDVFDGHVESVGAIDEPEAHDSPVVPIVLSEDGVISFHDALAEIDGFDNPEAVEIQLHADDELINNVGLSPELADSIAAGEWDGVFMAGTNSHEEAETLHESLSVEQ